MSGGRLSLRLPPACWVWLAPVGSPSVTVTSSQLRPRLCWLVRPRDLAGRPAADRRRGARRPGRIETKIKKATAGADHGPRTRLTLDGHPRIGPVVAARILADVGDVARFADRNRFASWTGTAPT